MILLAFVLPVAIYLLVLGVIHRRAYPVVVSGVVDCIGMLLASSGLLLLGGPAILSSLNERWRMFWLLGRREETTISGDGLWQFWIFLSVVYFVVVVSGAAYLLWQNRRITSIYNVDPDVVETVLARISTYMGLSPLRSGSMYLFRSGTASSPHLEAQEGEARSEDGFPSQSIDVLVPSPADPKTAAQAGLPGNHPGEPVTVQGTILEVDAFPAMHHVSLRWDPADSHVRRIVEKELERILASTPAPPSQTGGWLTIAGLALMALFLFGTAVLMLV